MRVLLIEDEARTAESVGLMLKSLGHDCDWAEDGESGAERALNREHDVILLDIMLPGIDGYDVLQQIRTAEVNTPVIMQSGLVERATAVKGLGLGATDYLIKPYGKEELAARMAATFERAQLRSGSSGVVPDAAPAPAEVPLEEPTPVEPAPVEPAPESDTAEASGALGDKAGKRRSERHAVIKTGRIVYRAATCVMDCVILNLSDHGAAIQPEDPLRAPDAFTLKIHFGPTYRCEVCWRYRNKLGVRFLER